MTPHSRGEFRILFSLSAPVVVAQVGMMAMSIVDLMMIARVGVTEVAAVGITAPGDPGTGDTSRPGDCFNTRVWGFRWAFRCGSKPTRFRWRR